MSVGLTPPMRLACPMSRGRILQRGSRVRGCWDAGQQCRSLRAMHSVA